MDFKVAYVVATDFKCCVAGQFAAAAAWCQQNLLLRNCALTCCVILALTPSTLGWHICSPCNAEHT